jgi:hypothetical protein
MLKKKEKLEEKNSENMDEIIEINDLSKYYFAKHKYEENYRKKLKKIRDTKGKLSDIKNKCIFCKKDLGMTFTNQKDMDNNIRILSYTCNNKPSCTTYTVNVPLCTTISRELTKFKNNYEEVYDVIIKSKYNILFNYITKINDFDILKENIIYYKNTVDHLIQTEQDIIHDKDRKQQLLELELKLSQAIIQEKESKEITIHRDIVDINQQIQDLKYSKLEFYNLSNVNNELFMTPYNLKDFEIIYS